MNNIVFDTHLVKSMGTKLKNIDCGCFHCLSIFPAYKVSEWDHSTDNNAICPFCGNNSVIISIDHKDINKEFLKYTKSKRLEKSHDYFID